MEYLFLRQRPEFGNSRRCAGAVAEICRRCTAKGPEQVSVIFDEFLMIYGLPIRIQRNELHILTPVNIDFDEYIQTYVFIREIW